MQDQFVIRYLSWTFPKKRTSGYEDQKIPSQFKLLIHSGNSLKFVQKLVGHKNQ